MEIARECDRPLTPSEHCLDLPRIASGDAMESISSPKLTTTRPCGFELANRRHPIQSRLVSRIPRQNALLDGE